MNHFFKQNKFSYKHYIYTSTTDVKNMTDWQDLNCTCLSKDGKKYDCFGQGTLACSSCIMAWPNRWKSVEPQVMFSVLVWHKEHGWGGMLLRGNGLALRRALRRCQGLSGKIWVIWQIWQQRPYPAESSGSWCRKLLLLPLYTLGPGHLNLLIPPPLSTILTLGPCNCLWRGKSLFFHLS